MNVLYMGTVVGDWVSTYWVRRRPLGLGEMVVHNVLRVEDFNTGAAVERIERHEGNGIVEGKMTKKNTGIAPVYQQQEGQVAGRSKSHVSCSSVMQAGIRREADKVGTITT